VIGLDEVLKSENDSGLAEMMKFVLQERDEEVCWDRSRACFQRGICLSTIEMVQAFDRFVFCGMKDCLRM